MSVIKYALRYLRWYHVVGLLLGVTAIIGVFWWVNERKRLHLLDFNDETDLIEAA